MYVIIESNNSHTGSRCYVDLFRILLTNNGEELACGQITTAPAGMTIAISGKHSHSYRTIKLTQ